MPLYTQLIPSDQVNPKSPNQYIDWWNGGRITLYASLYSDGTPLKALSADYTSRSSQRLVHPIDGATVPDCPLCQHQPEIFADSDDLPSNDPYQLTEYTFGAIDLTKDPYILDVKNVDYDVSYVDNAYLPAGMEPYNNPAVGWIGTIQDIDSFKTTLQKFLAAAPAFQGWPQYKDDQNETILRIPSALHIMLGDSNLTPVPPWAPIEKMKALWNGCVTGETEPICANIRDVRELFEANYANYKANYRTAFANSCDQTKNPSPSALDDASVLAHVYGWGPFNTNCRADANLLEDTPGYHENNFEQYQAVKAKFDLLNAWPTAEFKPYVTLIHDPQYLNAQYVYAYSVDGTREHADDWGRTDYRSGWN